MKWFLSLILATAVFLPSVAHATAIGEQEFTKVVYIESANLSPTPSANNSGRDYASAKPIATGNLFAIPKNVVISNVYVVVDEAVAGITAFSIGDADGTSSFVSSASPLSGPENLGVAGLHYYDLGYKGAYLKGAAGSLSNVALAKLYSATGKYVALLVTGTSTAGRARVVIKGYSIGASGL